MADEIEYNNEEGNDEEERLKELFTLFSDKIQRDKTWSSYPPFVIERVELLLLLNNTIDDINKSKEPIVPWISVSAGIFFGIIPLFHMSPDLVTFFTNPLYLFLIGLFLFTSGWTLKVHFNNKKVKPVTSNELYDRIEEISNG